VPTVYAHVATERARPGKLALQYWLYYVYNDWNNLHEGDWEMVQLVFDAPDARAALEQEPTSIGYSQHEGAERADWADDKLELVNGHPWSTRPRARTRTSTTRRSSSAARATRGRLRRHARPDSRALARCSNDPE
jgi:hypothetical protein